MKKTLCLLLAVLMLAGLLVGCGGGEEKTSTPPSSAPTGTTSTEPATDEPSDEPPAHEGAEIELPLSEDVITLDWMVP